MKIINIRGKKYEIDLKNKVLVNIDNPKDIREMLTQDEVDHFRSIAERITR